MAAGRCLGLLAQLIQSIWARCLQKGWAGLGDELEGGSKCLFASTDGDRGWAWGEESGEGGEETSKKKEKGRRGVVDGEKKERRRDDGEAQIFDESPFCG